MAEKSLLTLREIAEELGVNYRTIIDYKNHFRKYINLSFDGQSLRYEIDYIDFFRLILAFKEEGYSISMVKMSLSGHIVPSQQYLQEWVQRWMDMSIQGGMDGGAQTNLDGCVHPHLDGGIHPQMERGVHPSLDGCNHPSVDGDHDPQSSMGNDAQEEDVSRRDIESRLSQLKADLQAQIQSTVDGQLEQTLNRHIMDLKSNLEQVLLNMSAEINGPLTQFYKQITEIQDGLRTLEARLCHLESAPPLAADASLIRDETGYEEGRPGTHLKFECHCNRHCKLQKSLLQVSAGPPYTKDHGPGYLVSRPSPKGWPSAR